MSKTNTWVGVSQVLTISNRFIVSFGWGGEHSDCDIHGDEEGNAQGQKASEFEGIGVFGSENTDDSADIDCGDSGISEHDSGSGSDGECEEGHGHYEVDANTDHLVVTHLFPFK